MKKLELLFTWVLQYSIFGALHYYGPIQGNEGIINIFIFLLWLLLIIYGSATFLFNTKDKEDLYEKLKDKQCLEGLTHPFWFMNISAFLYYGWFVTAIISIFIWFMAVGIQKEVTKRTI